MIRLGTEDFEQKATLKSVGVSVSVGDITPSLRDLTEEELEIAEEINEAVNFAFNLDEVSAVLGFATEMNDISGFSVKKIDSDLVLVNLFFDEDAVPYQIYFNPNDVDADTSDETLIKEIANESTFLQFAEVEDYLADLIDEGYLHDAAASEVDNTIELYLQFRIGEPFRTVRLEYTATKI